METKQNPPVGLPTFNDMSRYGDQKITPYTLPDVTSDGGTSVADNSFDFPTPDNTTVKPKSLNPAQKARKEGRDARRNIRQTARAKKISDKNFVREQKLRQRKGEMLPIGLSSSGVATKTTLPNADTLTESPFEMMGQQYDQQSPQGTVPMQNLMPDQTAMSYQPPMPGNVQGTAKPLFNQSVTNTAQQIYGSEEQRQQSVPGAPLYFEKENALKAGKKKIEGKPYGTTIRNDKNYGGAPLRMHRGTPHKRDDGKGSNSSGKIPDFSGLIPPRNDGDDASLFGGLKRLTGVNNYVNSRYPTNQPYVAPKIPTNTSVLERFKTNKK